MPSTSGGIVYPASSDNANIWEHFQNMANSIQTLTDAIPRSKVIQKNVTETLSNNDVLQNDDDFVAALTVGTYRAQLYAHATISNTTAAPGIALGWQFSGTVTNTGRDCLGPGPATVSTTGGVTTAGSGIMRASAHGFATSITYGITNANAITIQEDLVFTVTASGTLQLQWSQAVASAATTTSLTSGSRLYITQLTAF